MTQIAPPQPGPPTPKGWRTYLMLLAGLLAFFLLAWLFSGCAPLASSRSILREAEQRGLLRDSVRLDTVYKWVYIPIPGDTITTTIRDTIRKGDTVVVDKNGLRLRYWRDLAGRLQAECARKDTAVRDSVRVVNRIITRHVHHPPPAPAWWQRWWVYLIGAVLLALTLTKLLR